MRSTIIGTGSYLPKKILTNFDLEKTVDTTHDWIMSRTGIVERHIAAEAENTSDLALNASLQAIRVAGIDKRDIGLIVLATTTPDSVFPSTACLLQGKLGIKNCPAFDIQAVCSGFVYALTFADLYIRSGQCKYALVVGAEIFSRLVDWSDRATCVLFGDGAGAVALGKAKSPGIISCHLHADGSHANLLAVPGRICAGGISGKPYVVMDGGAVFKFAVKVMDEMVDETLSGGKIKKEDIDWLVPHQANIRIIQAAAKKLSMNMDHVVVTVDKHANTSAASIPLALDVAVRDGRIRKNHIILMEAVGGGLTWGSVLVRWSFNF